MKIKDLIEIGKTKPKNNENAFFSLMKEFDIYDYEYTKEAKRLSYNFPIKWYCTDSYVGMRIYYLDEEPVCVSYQSGRKSDESFKWLSKEAFEKTRDFLYSLIQREELFHLIDENEKVDDEGFSVFFYSQLLSKEGYVNGNKVYIVDKGDESITCSRALIRYENGEQEIVPVSTIKIKYFS